jgi:hypothetical protein
MNNIEEEYLHDRIERLEFELNINQEKNLPLIKLAERVEEMSKKYAGCEILTREFPEIFKG